MIFRASGWVLIGLVASAGLLGGAPRSWGQGSSAAANAGGVATARLPDGHPDLNGYWGAGHVLELINVAAPKFSSSGEDVSTVGDFRHGKFSNLENDFYVASQAGDDTPLYKPQYWSQILDNERNASALDPYLHCFPDVPPRLGPPSRIMQSGSELVFFYFDMTNQYRSVPVGAPAVPADPDGTYDGTASAHWDGDTLVVETVGYNDQSWLSRAGYIHGFNLKTIERLRRQGDELSYDVTVEDPEYLQRPWVLPTVRVKLRPEGGHLARFPPCIWHDVPATLGSTLG